MSLNPQPVSGNTPSYNISTVKKKVHGAMPVFHPGNFGAVIENRFRQLERENLVARFWQKDESLWGEHPAGSISSYMGWTDVLDEMLENVKDIEEFASTLFTSHVSDVVLLGMGGSSLAPLMFQQIFGPLCSGMKVHVLDSTDAEAIRELEEDINLESVVFILASKSGTTAEPNAMFDYFYDRCVSEFGKEAGKHFIAITDPDTALQASAKEKGFLKTFLNYSEVGGRFSVLTYFGLVPAAITGIDIGEMLKRAIQLKVLSELESSLPDNPGFVTGIALGELARNGKDKLTFILPEEIKPFYLWLEQLIAESTGKHGKGLLPVSFRKYETVETYSTDRIFVHYHFEKLADPNQDMVNQLIVAGHPVISIPLTDHYDLGREFFRWEMITAVASTLLFVNPFDQPDVQTAKDNTKKFITKLEETGKLPARKVSYKEDCLRFLYPGTNLNGVEIFKDFFQFIKPGDFICLLAYLNETPENSRHLEDMALAFEKKYHVPVTIGYGPRYLHSTGQFHKGGTNRGFFIEIISEGMAEVPLPGRSYGFSDFILAQALGDYESLVAQGRKVLRIDIGKNRRKGMLTLSNTVLRSLLV
jgi:transaldolase / glucose-6-phosphate isomerase